MVAVPTGVGAPATGRRVGDTPAVTDPTAAADGDTTDEPTTEHPNVVADAVAYPPAPFPAALGVGEHAVLVFTGTVFAAVDVIRRDSDGFLDHDLTVLARHDHGEWEDWSSGGGPLEEDVFDRADRTTLRRAGARLRVLDDHVVANELDGRQVWAVGFLLRALPGVTDVDFAYEPARETLPVAPHGLVVVAAAITDPTDTAVFTARTADGTVVDQVNEQVLTPADENTGWPRPDLWARLDPRAQETS